MSCPNLDTERHRMPHGVAMWHYRICRIIDVWLTIVEDQVHCPGGGDRHHAGGPGNLERRLSDDPSALHFNERLAPCVSLDSALAEPELGGTIRNLLERDPQALTCRLFVHRRHGADWLSDERLGTSSCSKFGVDSCTIEPDLQSHLSCCWGYANRHDDCEYNEPHSWAPCKHSFAKYRQRVFEQAGKPVGPS